MTKEKSPSIEVNPSNSSSIFVISDVHLGLQKKDHCNLKEINSFVRWIASLNKQSKMLDLGSWGQNKKKKIRHAQKLILLGDILELRDATDKAIMTSSRTIDRFLAEELGEVEKIFIPGNHDCLVTNEKKAEWPVASLTDKVKNVQVESLEGTNYIFLHGHEFDRFHSKILNPISTLLAIFREGGLAYGTYGKILAGGTIAITFILLLGALGRTWVEYLLRVDENSSLKPFIEIIQGLRPGNPVFNFIRIDIDLLLKIFHFSFPGYPMAVFLTIWMWLVSLPILISLTGRFLWRVVQLPTKIEDVLKRCRKWWKRSGESYKEAKKVTIIIGHYHMATYLSSSTIKEVLGKPIDPTIDVDVAILPSWMYEDTRRGQYEPQNMGLLLDDDGITFIGWNEKLKKPFFVPLELLEKRRTTGEAFDRETLEALKSLGASKELLMKWERPLTKDLIFKAAK
ncbi:MAG: metallophosphoesterase [Candidatus Hermodarchaeota archaeon]